MSETNRFIRRGLSRKTVTVVFGDGIPAVTGKVAYIGYTISVIDENGDTHEINPERVTYVRVHKEGRR